MFSTPIYTMQPFRTVKNINFFFFWQIYIKNFHMIFSQKTTDLVQRKWLFHTKNDTKRVVSTFTLKIWRQFFSNFFFLNARLKNDENFKFSFMQTLSELFTLFYSYDARLFIKLYTFRGFFYHICKHACVKKNNFLHALMWIWNFVYPCILTRQLRMWW